MAHDEAGSLVTLDESLVVEAVDGVGGATGSVLLVTGVGVGIIVADEAELADLVLLEDERLDVAVGTEELLHVVVGVLDGEVLHVDVVHELPHVGLVVLGLELDDLHVLQGLGLEGGGGGLSGSKMSVMPNMAGDPSGEDPGAT